MKPTVQNAVGQINKHGALLVFPIKGKEQPLSLWTCFYPRSTMQWDWSEEGDDRVATIWHLRAKLSSSRKVAYVKWFQGRATFFSLELFSSLLQPFASLPDPTIGLPRESRLILETLEDDSPIPTKALRALCDLQGKENEAAFNRGLKQLWSRLLIVGYGEVDEGGFPSLAVGASKLLFEEQWDGSLSCSGAEAAQHVTEILAAQPVFFANYQRGLRSLGKF